jgi:hypothetical protein
MSKLPKMSILDGGVKAKFFCTCGKSFFVNIWGVVYKRDKQGRVLGQVETHDNVKKCKCGRRYIFVVIPDVAYKLLPKLRNKVKP